MKKIYVMIVVTALSCATMNAQVATFEDLGLAAESYWDGSDESAIFTSGDYSFINNFMDWGGYTSWDGFAYSTMTSTRYETLSDQYNSCVGHGADDSQTYAVVYYSSYMGTEPTVIQKVAEPFEAMGCYVTNAAYAYTSMLNGDDYSKKFGEDDWFLLTATGYLNNQAGQQAEFYLAKDGTIVSDWQYFDLSALGTVDEIHFTLSSSDTGAWGMNTPAYFCMDNFGAANPCTRIEQVKDARNAMSFDMMGRRIKGEQKGFVIKNGHISLH